MSWLLFVTVFINTAHHHSCNDHKIWAILFQLGALSDMITASGGGPRVCVDGGVEISSTPPDDDELGQDYRSQSPGQYG